MAKKTPREGSEAGPRKRAPLNMRTTPELGARIEVAAAETGRPLVQEVEYRLERSFSDPDARLQSLGSAERLKLLTALNLAVDMVETTMGNASSPTPFLKAYYRRCRPSKRLSRIKEGGNPMTLRFTRLDRRSIRAL